MNIVKVSLPPIKLVIAAGDDLVIVDHIQTTIQLQHHTVTHTFVVVNTLITPAILGIDFGITIQARHLCCSQCSHGRTTFGSLQFLWRSISFITLFS